VTVSRVARTLTLRRSGGKDVASSVGDGRGMFGVVWVCPVKFKVSHPCFTVTNDRPNITLEDNSKMEGTISNERGRSKAL